MESVPQLVFFRHSLAHRMTLVNSYTMSATTQDTSATTVSLHKAIENSGYFNLGQIMKFLNYTDESSWWLRMAKQRDAQTRKHSTWSTEYNWDYYYGFNAGFGDTLSQILPRTTKWWVDGHLDFLLGTLSTMHDYNRRRKLLCDKRNRHQLEAYHTLWWIPELQLTL